MYAAGSANLGRYLRPEQYRRLSHSAAECKYHTVFCPVFRQRVSGEDIAECA
jgi:hypothetical protein